MKWGLKGGISIDTDSGPLGYVFWCCGSRSWEVLTFFRLGLAMLCDCNASQHCVPFVQVLTSWVKVRFSCLIVTPSPYKTTDLSNLDTRMLSMCVCVLWEQKIKPFLKSGPQTHFLRSFKWYLSKIWRINLLQGKIQKERGTATDKIISKLFKKVLLNSKGGWRIFTIPK